MARRPVGVSPFRDVGGAQTADRSDKFRRSVQKRPYADFPSPHATNLTTLFANIYQTERTPSSNLGRVEADAATERAIFLRRRR
jgi:hypothetical protein